MSRRNLVAAALWLGSLVAVFVATRDPADPPVVRDAAPVVMSREGASLHDIRAAIRDEVRATHDRGATVPVAEPASPEPEPDDADYLEARKQLDDALADGRWSESDRDRLGAALAHVTRDQANELLAVLFPSLNSGRVTSEIAGPPL